MSREAEFHRLLTARALDPAARGLMDDAAVLGDLVLTHDTLVEGVHVRPDDPPESTGWKLAAANLSDLAAKGAEPAGCLLSYPLADDAAWDERFLRGLHACLDEFKMPLIGGDTVRLPTGSARVFGLTAIGRAPPGGAPSRSLGRAGDRLWISGPVGEAGWGLKLLNSGRNAPPALLRKPEHGWSGEHQAIEAYRFPRPHIALGRAMASAVTAMMDVSDGLLIDARRLATASGCGASLTDVPVSPGWAAAHGRSPEALLQAGTAGDDYVLLFAAPEPPPAAPDALLIGELTTRPDLRLVLDGREVALPHRLGWEH